MSERFKPPGQCPACGEWVPRGAAACDDCGACAKSGWSGDTHEDGLDLPDDEFNYDDFVAREFGDKPTRIPHVNKFWVWVALILFIILMLCELFKAFA